MSTLDYVREMEREEQDELERLKEEAWAAEIAYELDEGLYFAEARNWAIQHGLLNPSQA